MFQKNANKILLVVATGYSILLSISVVILYLIDLLTNFSEYSLGNFVFVIILLIVYTFMLISNVSIILNKQRNLFFVFSIFIYALQVLKFSIQGFTFDLIFGTEIYPYLDFTSRFKYGLAINWWDLEYTVYYLSSYHYFTIGVNLIAILLIITYFRLLRFRPTLK